jgi:hypothetical protein
MQSDLDIKYAAAQEKIPQDTLDMDLLAAEPTQLEASVFLSHSLSMRSLDTEHPERVAVEVFQRPPVK